MCIRDSPTPQHPTTPNTTCDWQSEHVCYAGGMARITFERVAAVLVCLGVLLVGGGVWLAFGLAATLIYAGAVCLVLGFWLALDAADNGSGA